MKGRNLIIGLMALFSWLSACVEDAVLPQPPLVVPFTTEQAGIKSEFEMQVTKDRPYKFSIQLGYRHGDEGDRNRVSRLAGRYGRMNTKLIEPGISIPLRLKINLLGPSGTKLLVDREFWEQEMYAEGSDRFLKTITVVRLTPGRYNVSIQYLKDVPELRGTPVALTIFEDWVK
ncbi:MAG: DUF5625 family protein [Nevskiales bacterium]